MQQDEDFMREALLLAANARGRTSPNPLVGAVIVREGRIVGAGWHRKAGTPHAEVHALAMAGDLAHGATAYVTLEPCSHHGRTGPCAEALVKAGVKRVVAAMLDPNPLVAGKGKAMLEAAGVEIVRAGEGERVDLAALMRLLAARDLTSVFVEGGGTLNFSLLAAGLVDKIHAFIAPKIVGGKAALTPVEGAGFAELADAAVLTRLTVEPVGADILLTGYVAKEAR